MRLETVLINGARQLHFVKQDKNPKGHFSVSGKGESYAVLIGRQWYACEKKTVGYTIKGDNMRLALIGNDPFFPKQQDEGISKRIIYDAVPVLEPI